MTLSVIERNLLHVCCINLQSDYQNLLEFISFLMLFNTSKVKVAVVLMFYCCFHFCILWFFLSYRLKKAQTQFFSALQMSVMIIRQKGNKLLENTFVVSIFVSSNFAGSC